MTGNSTHKHGNRACSGHAHGAHEHVPMSFGAAFVVAIILNLLIVISQVVFGLIGHSVALIADAGHNFSDVLGLVVAFAASQLGKTKPSLRFTYGLGGSSILAALFNAAILLIVTGALSLEALQRFFRPEPVSADLVMIVAGAAIFVNGLAGYLLSREGAGDLNVRAAVAHLVADAAVSAGVVIGALLIRLTGAVWIDPLISLLINATIVAATWGLLREAISMSLAGVPGTVNLLEVRSYLATLPGVTTLHDLHIWSLSTRKTAMTVHLVMPGGHPGDIFLLNVCQTLRESHGIDHATMQIETATEAVCALAAENVV